VTYGDIPHDTEQLDTAGVSIAHIVIGKVPAEVAFADRPQNCVGEGVGGHVRIRMTTQAVAMLDLHAAKDQAPSRLERMEVESLAYSEAHRNLYVHCHVDNRRLALQALAAMTEFWKRPKFWIAAIVILWLGYLLTANLSQPVELYIIPHFVHRTVTAAEVMLVAAVVGCAITLSIQFTWRRRSSKNGAASSTATG
jgi:hypothetical protein